MKKALLSLFVVGALFVPSLSFAQTVSPTSNPTIIELEIQLISLLQQYIALLQAQGQTVSISIPASNVSTGTEEDSVGSSTPAKIPDPTVSWDYSNGVLTYTGTYQIAPENIWFDYQAAGSSTPVFKSGVSVIDSTQSEGKYVQHIGLSPSVSGENSGGVVLHLQTRFPDKSWFFGNFLTVDASGKLVSKN